MAQLTIVYWRDIPAQVLVREGRRTERRPLPERFEQAIDRAAMKAGSKDDDSYLSEWRRGEPIEVTGDAVAVADAEVNRITTEFTDDKLRAYIAALGWTPELT